MLILAKRSPREEPWSPGLPFSRLFPVPGALHILAGSPGALNHFRALQVKRKVKCSRAGWLTTAAS